MGADETNVTYLFNLTLHFSFFRRQAAAKDRERPHSKDNRLHRQISSMPDRADIPVQVPGSVPPDGHTVPVTENDVCLRGHGEYDLSLQQPYIRHIDLQENDNHGVGSHLPQPVAGELHSDSLSVGHATGKRVVWNGSRQVNIEQRSVGNKFSM